MNMIRSLRIGPRLAAGFAILVLLLAAVAAVGVTQIRALRQGMETLMLERYGKVELINGIQKQFLSQGIRLRNLVIMTEAQQVEGEIAEMEDTIRFISARMQQLKVSVQDDTGRALLEKVSGADLSNAAFPFGTSKELEIGYARVRASRITYVGELGWELYIPTEFTAHVFEVLQAAGKDFGLTPAGMHTMNNCRTEKAYRHWGHDIADEPLPVIRLRARRSTPLTEVADTLFRVERRRTLVGLSLMAAQAFFYNAIFFTYALVLTAFYGISANRVGWSCPERMWRG